MCLESLDGKSKENTSAKSKYLLGTFVEAFLAIKPDI